MSFIYRIDVRCDRCGFVYQSACTSTRTRPRALMAITRIREAGWSHSLVRDLCPQCRPTPRNRLHHRKDVPQD